MKRLWYIMVATWATFQIDMVNRMRRLTGGPNLQTHTLNFRQRVAWRLYLFDSVAGLPDPKTVTVPSYSFELRDHSNTIVPEPRFYNELPKVTFEDIDL